MNKVHLVFDEASDEEQRALGHFVGAAGLVHAKELAHQGDEGDDFLGVLAPHFPLVVFVRQDGDGRLASCLSHHHVRLVAFVVGKAVHCENDAAARKQVLKLLELVFLVGDETFEFVAQLFAESVFFARHEVLEAQIGKSFLAHDGLENERAGMAVLPFVV